ncbi:MAG: type I-U CRISPR-associated helicase/endonuclease Cas3 [Thermoguttaceae bacterium]|nr:type I-U CRISPR-associated helicase/endonuclease Cas3 [Thermoguttaceae bacterium]MDW8037570.1 type I-U CRISPR-associated helicase/endonuclease Cas3 [Thermoguttaceae bacterium]
MSEESLLDRTWQQTENVAFLEERFAEVFSFLTGHEPFPWQASLYQRLVQGDIPARCNIPTGLGKTAAVAVWLIALAHAPEKLPRRLVYVVNRRTVVDQTTQEVEQYRKKLLEPELAQLREHLQALCALPLSDGEPPLAISTLRGQFADNRQWSADPARPAVVVGTVDMIGSRLLFGGYLIGFRRRPFHAGLLGQDVLLVHDEAHLEPAFQQLLEQIEREIQKEQQRSGGVLVRPFRLMALSATLRTNAADKEGEPVFRLTDQERNPPPQLPDPPQRPLEHLWRRLYAPKRLRLVQLEDEKELVKRMVELALEFKDSGRAILIFARGVEDVEKIAAALAKKKQQVVPLTGTLRGYERDRLPGDPVFARFLPASSRPEGVQIAEGTVYLVCTSAGEVGVNLSGDHLICDLTTWESMVQRFGRVNRFGQSKDTQIIVVHPTEFEQKDSYEQARQKTLHLLKRLEEQQEGDASPASLARLDPVVCADAFAPAPTILPITDILLDAWSLTSIREDLPGRPELEPYLHGVAAWEPPETYVAWREEVEVITGWLLDIYPPEDLLDDYPLKPHELLRDQSDRVWKHLKAIGERHPDSPVWLIDPTDRVRVSKLGQLIQEDKSVIHYRTVLLPPSVGGLENGLLKSDGKESLSPTQPMDVADEWFADKEKTKRRRCRIWSEQSQLDPPPGMRLIQTIDTQPDAEEFEPEESESLGLGEEALSTEANQQQKRARYWHWYESLEAGDTEGSLSAPQPVGLDEHTEQVVHFAQAIAQRLQLPDWLRSALSLAAKWHDRGKDRAIWQRAIGNWQDQPGTQSPVLAKAGGKNLNWRLLSGYRHEFGSLLEAEQDEQIQKHPERDLILHLIAAHHGRARPHFDPESFDTERFTTEQNLTAAQQVMRRFGRLQQRFGRWGLAWLESLLRCADVLVSQIQKDSEHEHS